MYLSLYIETLSESDSINMLQNSLKSVILTSIKLQMYI